MGLIHRLWESLRATRFKRIKISLCPGIESQRLTGNLVATSRLTSSKSTSPVTSITRWKCNNFLLGYLLLGLQWQNRAARQRCCAVLLNQLERLAHAHGAEVCAGDLSCEDDGARQPLSWTVYWSACPIGLKRRGARLNYVEFVLYYTAVTKRQCYYTIFNVIYNYSNSLCPF